MSSSKSTRVDVKFRGELPDDGGGSHVGISSGIWRERSVRAYDDGEHVCVHIGDISLVLTPNQWQHLFRAVNTVMPHPISIWTPADTQALRETADRHQAETGVAHTDSEPNQ